MPHEGSLKADIGKLLSSNIQIKELSVLSDTLNKLSREWFQTEKIPKAKYIYAAHDSYVDKKKSSLAIHSHNKDIRAVDEDHSSICKPKDNEQTTYKAVRQYINEFSKTYSSAITIETFVDENQFDSQYFVIKMVVSDIHSSIQNHAKEYFYNAELIGKIFTNDHDRKKLNILYKKIKHIYQEEFEKHISEDTTPDKLISSVHARIMKEDKNYLNEVLSSIDSVHKKGMLHQLSNNADDKILWSSKTNLEEVLNFRLSE